MIYIVLYFLENMNLRINIPKVPTTQLNEEVDIAIVNAAPDCRADYRAKFKAKYIKNLNIQRYISKNVAFLTDLYLNKSQ